MKRLTQSLNAAVDTATMGSWLQAALQAATKKKYIVKNDNKSVYVLIDNSTQVVITPKTATSGSLSKQTKKGSTVQADPAVEYKNTTDCITKLISTLQGKTSASKEVPATPVDSKLFGLSANLHTLFGSGPALNASKQKLNATVDEPVVTGEELGEITSLTEALAAQGWEYEEFPSVMFNPPDGSRAVIAFYDPSESCFVTVALTADVPGDAFADASSVIQNYQGVETASEDTWMTTPGDEYVEEGEEDYEW